MRHFETGTYFSISILFVFFRFRLPLRTFWPPFRDIFSNFCLKLQEIAFFGVNYSQILLKLRNSLLKGAKIPDILPKFLRFPDEQERIFSIKFKIKSCSKSNSLQNPIITFLKKFQGTYYPLCKNFYVTTLRKQKLASIFLDLWGRKCQSKKSNHPPFKDESLFLLT